MAFDVSQTSFLSFRDIVAERTSNIVVWVGAGLSVEAGLPTWRELKNHLLGCLNEKAMGYDEKSSDRGRLESLHSYLKAEPNYWRVFQSLYDNLGQTTYKDEIRRKLGAASAMEPPSVYSQLWRLPINGVISLNLDRLATKAYVGHAGAATLPVEFSGEQVRNLFNVVNTPTRFVANVHGILEDVNSWIFTARDLERLMQNEGYTRFIDYCLTSSTILFVGITADDVAVGGHLDRLAKLGIPPRTHFWLTHRRDPEAFKWGESVGIRVIRYKAPNNDHSEVNECIRHILSFVPKDDPSGLVPVVTKGVTPSSSIPPPQDLVSMDADEIRNILNGKAKNILAPNDEAAYSEYDQFALKYDEAIYRAWYTSDKPGRNRLLDYTLDKLEATGAFGRVYSARHKDGRHVAVKVLLEDIRNDRKSLESFRRGVRSMQILEKHGVKGMVSYLDASEIPAFVVMEWIDGPNLSDAVKAKQLDDWDAIVGVGADLANIVHDAHLLPERVLHRDLRPSNVMLEGLYTEGSYTVKVLDFDLSWHKGASDKSVLFNAAWGYLAPEQMEHIPGASTRNAAVDSFGFGMTLYFMISARDPMPEEHRHSGWQQHVEKACGDRTCKEWRSLPTRIARLIYKATLDVQSSRLDLGEIAIELGRLRKVLRAPDDVTSAELVAEELASRSPLFQTYRWNIDAMCAEIEKPSGFRLLLKGDEPNARVTFRVDWTRLDHIDRKRVAKWIPTTLTTLRDVCVSKGWKVSESGAEQGRFVFEAHLPVAAIMQDMASVDRMFDKLTNVLRFD